ncbi:MAG: ACP S-malonyltransferase [Gemmatimonadaceae bacterium]|jgi:[acyl-carrier-protein] S-malonyltransferase|nr:ACP S-malonyltransferase [Gemmatimonadaceae bacterium]
MDIVLLLPGQGSQKVGMGRDLFEASAAARTAFETVDTAIGTAISALAFEGPDDELRRTHNAQPALLAHSAAAWAMLADVLTPHVRAAAGHSLGEFSAYHVAGALELPDAARIVRRRGQLMYETGTSRPGAMSAIVGTLTTPIETICAQASAEAGLVVPANYNSPEQVVISGETAGVERAMELAKAAGAKRCLPLPVSGAFHSPLMAPAAGGLDAALEAAALRDPRVPVFANVDGSAITRAAAARPLLVQQLTAPVHWTLVMRNLVAAFPTALYIELGTGSVLSGLARRIAPDVRTMTAGTLTDIEKLLELLHTETAHAH